FLMTYSPILFLFFMIPTPLRSSLFPYTTLFRSTLAVMVAILWSAWRFPFQWDEWPATLKNALVRAAWFTVFLGLLLAVQTGGKLDRKSTRLNSSHVSISYAVFCLKKKN